MVNQHYENLKVICKQIGDALALEIDKNNPDELCGKLSSLTNLLSTSSHAVALSELLYNEKIMTLALDNQYTGMTATDKKMIFAGRAKNEVYYLTLADRQNRSIVHSIDALRSIISFLKTEMANLPNN
jgi:hypothetical protein